jgi:trans-2,3-dihydro-3-hydroxyanthranilate isomerase
MAIHRYVLCDVFTSERLKGNALAVFTRALGLSGELMQAIAREMNLSETVFVMPASDGAHARLRIFTPTRELLFAGHPVLGSAVVLGGPLQTEVVRLETGRGIVDVRLEREGARIVFGWMQQPVPKVTAWEEQGALLAALGLAKTSMPIELYDNGTSHLMVKIDSRSAVADLEPDLKALEHISAGVSVFAGEGTEYKTRMFAPAMGVPEDPATGSAAGPLAWHLVRHAALAPGATLRLEQGAEVGRPSTLYARVEGDAAAPEAILVGGAAVVVGRGELML